MNTSRLARACSWPMNSDEPLRAQRGVGGVVLAALRRDQAAGVVVTDAIAHSVRSRLYLFGSSSPKAATPDRWRPAR